MSSLGDRAWEGMLDSSGGRDWGSVAGARAMGEMLKESTPGRTSANTLLAREIGVTPRTVQRWFTTGAERRTPSPAAKTQLRAAGERADVNRMVKALDEGVDTEFAGEIGNDSGKKKDIRRRLVRVRLEPGDRHVAGMKAALRSGDKEAFGESYFRAMAYEWKLPGEDEEPPYSSWTVGDVSRITFDI